MTAEYTVSWRECICMRMLPRDGWTAGELKMCFNVSAHTVRRHVVGRCAHDHGYPPLDGWDGQTTPQKLTAPVRIPEPPEEQA